GGAGAGGGGGGGGPSRGPPPATTGCDVHVSETGGEGPIVTLSDDVVTLRPWSRPDAAFMAEASADPGIRRYNGGHDRLGRPAPVPSTADAAAVIDQFAANWRALSATRDPPRVALATPGARSDELGGVFGGDGAAQGEG